MKLASSLLAAASLLVAGTSYAALSAGDQYNLDQIRSGSPVGIRSAAQNIQASGNSPELVTDTLAEALLTNQNNAGTTYIDALSWSCKALAATGNKRYYSALKTVADNDGAHRKLRKYCNKAADQLGSAEGPQYAAGSAALKGRAASASKSETAAVAASAPPAGGYKPLSEAKVDMSMQQVYSIIGPPTSTNSHITGKAFIPFNFRGKDSYRSIAHYKGQGRIVFSNSSAYSSDQRVLEVQMDPNESGFQ
ncbi:MAG TPA: hypothetical protein VIR56_11750 [Solimonas sp.]